MAKPLGVGIVGASADRGWAKVAHVPTVQALRGLELAAVASGDQAKSNTAARDFGAKAAYGDTGEMFRDQNVDIVTIAVKVPDHRELVLSALKAGKHVYCEWPLGHNTADTEELAAAARSSGVHVAIGLQTRANPAARRARELIASGAIGRILSARVVSDTAAFGPEVEPAMAFAEDPESGVTLVSIQGAHTLDFAIAMLGSLANLSALATTQYPEVTVSGSAVPQTRSTPDHLIVQSRLADGSALSLEVAGGRPPEATPFRFEMTGERGSLLLQGGAMRGFQSGRLQLFFNGAPETVDEGEAASLPDEAANVAGMYALLRDDILNGARNTPDFNHALRLTRLIDDVMLSSRTGIRREASAWPGQKES